MRYLLGRRDEEEIPSPLRVERFGNAARTVCTSSFVLRLSSRFPSAGRVFSESTSFSTEASGLFLSPRVRSDLRVDRLRGSEVSLLLVRLNVSSRGSFASSGSSGTRLVICLSEG